MIGQWLTQMDWLDLYSVNDPSDILEKFHEIISINYRRSFDLVTMKCKPHDKPWFNDRLRRVIVQRDLAFKQNANNYRSLRDKVQRIIRSAKRNFYEKKMLT